MMDIKIIIRGIQLVCVDKIEHWKHNINVIERARHLPWSNGQGENRSFSLTLEKYFP